MGLAPLTDQTKGTISRFALGMKFLRQGGVYRRFSGGGKQVPAEDPLAPGLQFGRSYRNRLTSERCKPYP
jgi:hypothetical protein